MFCFSSIASTSSRCSSPRGVTLRMPPVVTSAQVNTLLQQSNKWRLMPQMLEQNENQPSPSAYYGAIHLTRLFGKLSFIRTYIHVYIAENSYILKNGFMFLNFS